MLVVLSPAKKLDFESDYVMREQAAEKATQPRFLPDAKTLAVAARKLTASDLKAMMGISDALAELNVARFKAFKPPFTEANARMALDAFQGDVYVGLDAASMSDDDRAFAQDHIRILSGLYGLLRPFDLMQAYRLEMGTKFPNKRGNTLYDFWGDKISQEINKTLSGRAPVLINLASNEYFKSVRPKALAVDVITPVFKDIKDGNARVVSFLAKKARGMMARYMVDHRLTEPEALKKFDGGGYRFDDAQSDGKKWVFSRQQPPAGQG